ncbi:MAG: hypothetical protein Q9175_002315 [Cornicularia normoerica]
MGNVKTLISPSYLSQRTSFLDILRHSTLHHYNQPVPILYSNDTGGPWQNIDIEDTNLIAGQDSQDGREVDQDMIIEDHVPFKVKGLEAVANAMLGPGWIQGLDDIAVTQNTEASVGTDLFHTGVLDCIPHAQHIAWEQLPSEVRQAGHGYLQGTVPTYTDLSGSISTSLHDIMAPLQAQSCTTQGLEPADKSAPSSSKKQLYSPPTPTPAEVSKRASKRKLIMNVFSRKEPRLTPSHLSHGEDLSASTTDLSSKLALRTESAAKTATTSGTISSKQPSDDYQKEQPRTDWMPAWEQVKNRRTNLDNAGIVEDIRVSDSERRPMSWPHRNPWRKSLDISVAVLTKGFERLMTERGE